MLPGTPIMARRQTGAAEVLQAAVHGIRGNPLHCGRIQCREMLYRQKRCVMTPDARECVQNGMRIVPPGTIAVVLCRTELVAHSALRVHIYRCTR